MRPTAVLWILLALVAAPAAGQTVTLTAPSEVSAGADFEVKYSGATEQIDFISVDAKGAASGTYGHYKYVKSGNPVTLRAPDVPGEYDLRYHEAKTPYTVRASVPLRVADVAASVTAPASVDAGAAFEAPFTGPNTAGDFISIDRAGAADRDYGAYVYTNKGTPAALRAPDQPGSYAVRYHLGQTYRVVAAAPLTVGGVGATITAADAVMAGAPLSIQWTGPNDARDFVSIDTEGAADRDYGTYAYTADGAELTLRAPEDPGNYQIRYHTGQTYRVLGARPLRVDPATATLDGPAEVAARAVFDVAWTGPSNPEDYVSLAKPADEAIHQSSLSYAKRGSPARLEAPPEPGSYELRYVTGQKHHVLARKAIAVTPGTIPGTLRVTAPATTEAAYGAVELILDASGSMLQRIGGKRRIDLAKAALVDLSNEVIPAGTPFALRVFGHREANSCRTDLEIPLAPLDRGKAVARIQSIESKNLAKTPIGASLAQVPADLKGVTGSAVVVLVTDGEETCDGDPKAAIENLRKAGFDFRVNIVGFAIDELALEEQFRSWAEIGRGGYFEASDGKGLAVAMRAALRLPFQVKKDARVVASGIVNGDAIELLPGSYDVDVQSSPPRPFTVQIEPQKETVHTIEP